MTTTTTGAKTPYGTPEYGRQWREKHKERLKKARKTKQENFWNPRRLRRNYWLGKYKTAKGCFDCGYKKHAVALDFDHKDPNLKRFSVSHRVERSTLKTLFAEIRKCRVLCANCHRIRTHLDKLP